MITIRIKSPKIEFEAEFDQKFGNFADTIGVESQKSNIVFLDFIKGLITKVSEDTEKLKDVW